MLALGACTAGTERGFAAEPGRVVEHITLANGFDLICDHREESGDRVRLYTDSGSANFIEVGSEDVTSIEKMVLPAAPDSIPTSVKAAAFPSHADLTKAELHELLSSAGAQHHLDVNLLASVVHAESGGHTAAVSRKGAQGLMQLMPKTAAQLGVSDSLSPDQNVAGGASYLDLLLTRYHDNLALALAAYNAGPAVVDHCHCVPPYRETRLYVARIIRDFNASAKSASKNAAIEAAKVIHTEYSLPVAVPRANEEQASLKGATAP